MHVLISLAFETECSVEKEFVDAVVMETLEKGGSFLAPEKKVSVEVVFVDQENIRALNKQHRNKDAVTDVLSFGNYENQKSLEQETGSEILLGQVIVCYDYVVEAAHEDGVPVLQELAYVVSHGVLHVLGYDHSEEMFAIQDDVSEAYAQTE